MVVFGFRVQGRSGFRVEGLGVSGCWGLERFSGFKVPSNLGLRFRNPKP